MSVTPYIEFNNKAMEKLWIYLINQCMFISDTDAANAFIKCDEELTDIQDQCEHWKIMYANACGDQDVLKENIRLLDTENRSLKQKVHDQEKEYKSLQDLNLDIIAKHNEDMRQLRTENEDLRKDNEKLGNTLQDLQKEHDELKKDCAYMTNSRDTWRTRAKHAEAEVEELKKKLDLQQHAYNGACIDRNQLQEALDNIRAELAAKVKRMDEITNDRDTYNSLYDELKKDYVKLSEENKRLNTRNDCLREEVKWYRKHCKEQSDKIRELQAVDIRKYSWHGDRNAMTPTISEANRKAILKLLLNKSFGASPEYMREYMRYSLRKFCDDHCFCQGCPLRFSDCNFDDMSDEEIEKWYKIAISSK